jgi:hypothetical protein
MIRAGVDLLRDTLIIHRYMGVHSTQLIGLPDKRIDTILTKDYKVVCIQVCR